MHFTHTRIIHVGTHVEWLIQYEIYLIKWENNQYLTAINIYATIVHLLQSKYCTFQLNNSVCNFTYTTVWIFVFSNGMIPYAIFTTILQQSKLAKKLSCVLHQNCELQHNKHKSGGVGKPVKQLSYWVTCKLPTYLPITTKTVGPLQCVVCGDWTQQIVHFKFQQHSVCNFEGTEATVQSPYAILGAYLNNHTLYLGRYSKIVILVELVIWQCGVGDIAKSTCQSGKVDVNFAFFFGKVDLANKKYKLGKITEQRVV